MSFFFGGKGGVEVGTGRGRAKENAGESGEAENAGDIYAEGLGHGGKKRRVPRKRGEPFCVGIKGGAQERTKNGTPGAKTVNPDKRKKKWDGRGGEREEHRKKNAGKKPNGGRRSGRSEGAAHVVCVDERGSSVGAGT